MNKHKQSNVVKDYKNFPKKIEELKSYMVKFDKFDVIKLKFYPPDCTMGKNN